MDFLPEQFYRWMYVPHHFNSWVRFYNYNYALGELLVLSLYDKYRKEGSAFIPAYRDLLERKEGTVNERLKNMGLDLTKKEVWEKGMSEVKRFLTEFKEQLSSRSQTNLLA